MAKKPVSMFWTDPYLRADRPLLIGSRVYNVRIPLEHARYMRRGTPSFFHAFSAMAVPPEFSLRFLRDSDIRILEYRGTVESLQQMREEFGAVTMLLYHPKTSKRIIV